MNKRVIASLDHTYSSRKLGATILFTLGILGLVIIISIADFNNFNIYNVFKDPLHHETIPYFIPSLVICIFLLLGLILMFFHLKKRSVINTLLKTGTRAEASIISSIQDFSVTTNKVPRRIVKFKTDTGQIFTFKAFDYGLVPHLTANKMVPIIYNDKGKCFQIQIILIIS